MNRLFINKEWSPLKKLLFMNAASGGGSLTEYTATGNPVSFNTNVSKPLNQMLIPFSPVQEGSGDPSPSNVRPITGWTGVDVTANGTTIPVTFPAEAGTVYGGTLDLTTGVLTVDMEYALLNDVSKWVNQQIAAYDFRYAVTFSNRKHTSDFYAETICSYVPVKNSTLDYGRWSGTTGDYFCIKKANDSTLDFETLKADATAGNISICYPLAEPIEYQLTPQQIQTLIGDNVIITSTNGQNTVKYLKKG